MLFVMVVEHWQLQEHAGWLNGSARNFVMRFARLFSHLSIHFSKSAPASSYQQMANTGASPVHSALFGQILMPVYICTQGISIYPRVYDCYTLK